MKLAVVRRKLGRVDRAIGKAIERGEIPGTVVLAGRGDKLRYEGVFGAACLSPERHPTRLNTLYDLASLTKVMATTPALFCWLATASSRSINRLWTCCRRSPSVPSPRSLYAICLRIAPVSVPGARTMKTCASANDGAARC